MCLCCGQLFSDNRLVCVLVSDNCFVCLVSDNCLVIIVWCACDNRLYVLGFEAATCRDNVGHGRGGQP